MAQRADASPSAAGLEELARVRGTHGRFASRAAGRRHLVSEAVVVIACHRGVAAVLDVAADRRKGVPDAGAAAGLGCCPFDLVGRGRGTPDKAVWKYMCLVHRGFSLLFVIKTKYIKAPSNATRNLGQKPQLSLLKRLHDPIDKFAQKEYCLFITQIIPLHGDEHEPLHDAPRVGGAGDELWQ